MKEWDLDRSGSVSVIELSAAASAHKKVKQEGRLMRRTEFYGVLARPRLGVQASYKCEDHPRPFRHNPAPVNGHVHPILLGGGHGQGECNKVLQPTLWLLPDA